MNNALLELEKFEARNNKEYEIKAIIDSTVYGKKTNNQMPSLYYLVFWKGYTEEKSTLKPSTAVIYLWKLINTFYKEYPKKTIVTFLSLDSTPPIARLIVPKK